MKFQRKLCFLWAIKQFAGDKLRTLRNDFKINLFSFVQSFAVDVAH